jgi:uncharacterized membrane protein
MGKKSNSAKKPLVLQRVFPFILIIAGIFALLASTMIMVEKLHVLENPGSSTICDINPIISCGSVMKTDQAKIFGFDNSFMGLIAFPVFITVGFALLAGATFKRWFWVGLQFGALFAVAFIHWLIYQSVFTIQSLCPFCMVLWVSTIALFWYVTVYNLKVGNLSLPQKFKRLQTFILAHHVDIIISWYLLIAALVLYKFWYYFGTLI